MNQFVAEWNTWRDSRNSSLATPFGWLSVVGLHWLDEETTWADAPGTFTVADDGWVRLALEPGTKAGPAAATFDLLNAPATGGGADSTASGASATGGDTVDGNGRADDTRDGTARTDAPARTGDTAGHLGEDGRPAPPSPQVRVEDNGFSAKLPAGGSLDWFTVGHVLFELIDRGGRIGVRIRDAKSPLLSKFVEVPVFDPNPDFVFLGRFTPYAEPQVRPIASAAEGVDLTTTAVGEVTFTGPDGEVTLVASGCPATGLQLDYHDATNGDATAAWRTLDLGIPNADGSLVVDFNRAVNYPFAFSAFATCPAPVGENVVPFAVTAGERRPPFFYSEAGINVPFLFYVWWDAASAEVTRPWYARFGLDMTVLNPNEDAVDQSLVGFDGVAMSGGDLTPLSRKARSRLVKVATDALTSRLPVIGMGAFTDFVVTAQRELREAQGHAEATPEPPTPTPGRVPIVMNSELDPKSVGLDVVHTDATGLIYAEADMTLPLESTFSEIAEFEAALAAKAPIGSWEEFDFRVVTMVRRHR